MLKINKFTGLCYIDNTYDNPRLKIQCIITKVKPRWNLGLGSHTVSYYTEWIKDIDVVEVNFCGE